MNVGTWGGKGETALFGDFGIKDIDKGNAIRALLMFIHRDIKDTIAFGDAKVDIDGFEFAKTVRTVKLNHKQRKELKELKITIR